jgi:hypothetical protein
MRRPIKSARRTVWCVMEALEFRRLLTSASASDVFTYHGDGGEDGQDLNETVLTPADVNSTDFGKLWTATLDGQVYAQPLAVANVNITRGSSQGIHNVIFVATMHDSLFAIDANTGAILWQDSFLQIANPEVTTILSPVPTTGVTTVPVNSTENALISSNVGPELGILTTPAIDPTTGYIFVNTETKEVRGSNIDWVQRLWAVKDSDGSVAITPSNPAVEPTSGGMVVGDTIFNTTAFSSYTGYEYVAGPYVKGTGNNNPGITNAVTGDTLNNDADGWVENPNDTTSIFAGSFPAAKDDIAFNPLQQMNRVAITILNGVAYLGFASHGDDGPYYGWILGYSTTTLQNVVAWVSVSNYEPYGIVSGNDATYDAQAGFWGSGAGFTTDGTYLYIAAGNGAFNPTTANFSSTFTSTDVGAGGTQNIVQMPLDDDYGDAVLKLAYDPSASQTNVNVAGGVINNPNGQYTPDGGYDANGFGLKVVDYFTPSNVFEMNLNDEDVGSTGVLLIPSTGAGSMTAPDGDAMLTAAGKEGRLYLIDADNLGGYNTAYVADGFELTNEDPSGFDRVLGEFYYYEYLNPGNDANNESDRGYDTQSYFNGEVFIGLGQGTLPELGFSVSSLITGTVPPDTGVGTSPNFVSTIVFGDRGTTATISASGLSNGVIWNNVINENSSDSLQAFQESLTGSVAPLFSSNSTQPGGPSNTLTGGVSGATGVKFSLPTVFSGMVYDATGGGNGTGGHILGTLVGYGLLSSFVTSTGFSAPSSLTASYTTGDVHLSWTRHSRNENVVEVDRSSNSGSTWSVLAYLANGAFTFDDTTVASGATYEYRVQAVSGPNLSGYSNTATITTVVTSPAPALLSAVSRKSQGSAVYDIPISLTGSSTSVEDRAGGPTQLVLIFNSVIAQGTSFGITLSSGTVNSFTLVGPILTINLAGATNGTILTANINNLTTLGGSTLGSYTLKLGVLFGDVNGDGTVNSTDQSLAQGVEGSADTGQNFRADVDCNGVINSTDVSDIAGGAGASDVESIGPVITLPPPVPDDSTPAISPAPTIATQSPSEDDSQAIEVAPASDTADPPTPPTQSVDPAIVPTASMSAPPPLAPEPIVPAPIATIAPPPTPIRILPVVIAKPPPAVPSISVHTIAESHLTPPHLLMSWRPDPGSFVFASPAADTDSAQDDLLQNIGKSILN